MIWDIFDRHQATSSVQSTIRGETRITIVQMDFRVLSRFHPTKIRLLVAIILTASTNHILVVVSIERESEQRNLTLQNILTPSTIAGVCGSLKLAPEKVTNAFLILTFDMLSTIVPKVQLRD